MNPSDDLRMSGYYTPETGSGFGFLRGAGVGMILLGLLHVVAGITAVTNNGLYVIGRADIFNLGGLTWGWIQFVSGIALLAAGIGLFAGAAWARVVTMLLAAGAILLNIAYLPHYPVWSIWMIGLSGLILGVLIAQRRESKEAAAAGGPPAQ
jgi:hypothetical protein